MTYRGHIKNGQIVLDEPARLPEGAQVNVQVVEESAQATPTEDPDQILIARGLLRSIPPGKDPARFRNWHRGEIEGKPLSQTIIEERR